MSLNTAHANNGVLIHSGEAILLYSDNVTMEFSGQDNPIFKGTKHGKIYLTTHRAIYNAKKMDDSMQSFSFPFICLTDVELEQPVFGANYIRGKVRAQENGNFVGEAKFKLLFKSGGAIDFAQAMLRAAHMANDGHNGAPPPYTPPTGGWHEAPPPAYTPNPSGYYGWLPNSQAFPNGPDPNTVFMIDNPPPYPGIVPQGPTNANSYPGTQPYGYPQAPTSGGYPQVPASAGYPQVPASAGYPQPPTSGGYPQPPTSGGYPQPPTSGGYPQPPTSGGYQRPPTYPVWGNPNGFVNPPTQGYPGYTPPNAPANAMGFAPPPNSKEAEAAQSSHYNPQPQPFAPPPGYNEPPPSYSSLNQPKKEQ